MKVVFLEKGFGVLYKIRGLGKCLFGVWIQEGYMFTLFERNFLYQVIRRYLGWGLFCYIIRFVSFLVNCQLFVKQVGVVVFLFRVGFFFVLFKRREDFNKLSYIFYLRRGLVLFINFKGFSENYLNRGFYQRGRMGGIYYVISDFVGQIQVQVWIIYFLIVRFFSFYFGII